MAKFNAAAIATAVVIFSLFSVSLTRTPPQNSDDTTAVTLLLSDGVKADTTAVTLPLADGVKADTTAVTLPLADGVKAEDSDTATAIATADPLTEATSWPNNHYFHVRSEHPCSHHFKVDPTMREFMEISDSNDMIVSSGDFEDEDSDSDSDSDDEDDHDRTAMIEFEGHNRFDRKKLKALKKMRKNFRPQNEEEEEQKNGGLLRRVRQFLDLYF